MAAIIHWAQAISGDFSDAADWSGGVVPGAHDDTWLDAPGSAFTVTSSADERVYGLDTASNASLMLTGDVFTDLNGTDGGANAGRIAVESGATLAVGDTLVNSGAISVADAGRLIVGSAADREVDLTGGGTVSLNAAGARIVASAEGGALFNLDNTVTGTGYIGLRGVDTLEIVNFAGGVIEAVGPGSLVLQASGVLENGGELAATNGGTLVIRNTLLGQDGAGWLFADTGSRIKLENTQVIGGLLAAEYTGSIEVIGQGDTLDGGSAAVTVNGLMVVGGGDRLTLSGEVDILYRLELGGGGAAGPRDLVIGQAGATLGGYGKIVLGGGGTNRIYGQTAGAILYNQRTYITGAGLIGDGAMTLVNGPSGRITGDGSSPLIIDTGANPIINAGVIEAVNRGVTLVQSLLDNTGTLDTKRGGALTVEAAVTGAGGAYLMGGTLAFQASFDQDVTFVRGDRYGGELVLGQARRYHATVTGFSGGGATSLDLRDIAFVSAGEASFAGDAKGGVLTVSDGTYTAQIHLKGDYLGASFVAASDGAGGTVVVDTTTLGALHRFTAASAALPAASAAPLHVAAPAETHPGILARPHTALA